MARKNINNLSFETMASVIDSVDIGLDSEGDLMVLSEDPTIYESADGEGADFEGSLKLDICTVGNFSNRVTEQMIIKRLQSEPGDWERDPYSGAYLQQFVGEKMNQNTLSNIKNTIIKTLTYDGFILNENLKVELIPVTKHQLTIILLVRSPFANTYSNYSFGFDIEEHGGIRKY